MHIRVFSFILLENEALRKLLRFSINHVPKPITRAGWPTIYFLLQIYITEMDMSQ